MQNYLECNRLIFYLLSSTDCAYGDRFDCGTFPGSICYGGANNLYVCCALCQNAETGIAGMYMYDGIRFNFFIAHVSNRITR